MTQSPAEAVSAGGAFRVTLVTLFPEFFPGPLATSLLGKAVERGDIAVDTVNPRDFAADRHRTVDDTPYGGGPGMVLKPEPTVAAIEAARERNPGSPVVLLDPQGQPFTARLARLWAGGPGLILVCGRYEGFDERIRRFVDAEASIGDYVLSGGEPAALVIVDAVSREREGVLGNAESTAAESFAAGLLEYPQYTRPVEFRGLRVPEILLSGHHAAIDRWRRGKALVRTRARRPDLFERLVMTKDDEALLQAHSAEADELEGSHGCETDSRED